jgi:cytochrome c peroxidase
VKPLLITLLLIANLWGVEVFKDASQWQRPDEIPFPKENPMTKEKIALGKKLFFDPILSRGHNLSCASCHDPRKGWSDGVQIAIGDQHRNGIRNSPTLLNSAYQFVYFWDGRAKSLEAQSLGPITSHVEMNLDLNEALKRIEASATYRQLFADVFPKEGITQKSLSQALATFQRTLVSGKSRFDRWIAGDASQLTAAEVKGFHTFLTRANCNVCHSSFRFSDQSFNNVGINNGDKGRANVKKRAIWHGAFKTPTLRDIAHTAPYFHDGSVATLEEAVAFCAKGSRDKNGTVSPILIDKALSEEEIESIVSFLHTLSEPVFEFSE